MKGEGRKRMPKPRVVLREEEQEGVPSAYERRRLAERAVRLLGAAGLAFAAVGLTDLVLLWIPARLDSVSWEYATLTQTFDALPLVVLGAAFIAYVLARQPGRRANLAAALALGAFAVLLAGLMALFATVVPAIVTQTPPEAMLGARRSMIRTGVAGVAYTLLFTYLAVRVWRARPKVS